MKHKGPNMNGEWRMENEEWSEHNLVNKLGNAINQLRLKRAQIFHLKKKKIKNGNNQNIN